MGAMLLLHGNLELSELLGIQRSFRFVVADLPRRSNEHLHHCRQGGVRNYDACDTFAICLRTLLSGAVKTSLTQGPSDSTAVSSVANTSRSEP
jgi:hypothetical protein